LSSLHDLVCLLRGKILRVVQVKRIFVLVVVLLVHKLILLCLVAGVSFTYQCTWCC